MFTMTIFVIFTIQSKKYNVVKTLVAKKKYNAAIFAKGSRKKNYNAVIFEKVREKKNITPEKMVLAKKNYNIGNEMDIVKKYITSDVIVTYTDSL